MLTSLPTRDELAARLASSETTRVALAAQLETTRRELWSERAMRRFPAIESVVDLIPHATEEADFMGYAEKLARFAASG